MQALLYLESPRRRRRRRRQEGHGHRFLPSDDEATATIVAEINITPLTDVFLVLLIIFMVTTSVIANQGKNVDLPERREQPARRRRRP